MPGLGELAALVLGGLMVYRGAKTITSALNGLAEPDDVIPAPRRSSKALTRRGGMTERHEELGSIDSRVARIRGLIHKSKSDPKIRQLAVQIVSQKCGSEWCIPEKDNWGEIQAVFAAVRANVRYVRDRYGIDTFQSAHRTWQFGGGDCDDLSTMLASLLLALGYPVVLRVIRLQGSTEWDHIYVLVGTPPRDPQEWIPLDASVDEAPGWQAPEDMVAAHRDFEV